MKSSSSISLVVLRTLTYHLPHRKSAREQRHARTEYGTFYRMRRGCDRRRPTTLTARRILLFVNQAAVVDQPTSAALPTAVR